MCAARNYHGEIDDLVKPTRVHQRIYTDPDVFELEMDRIFGRVWLFVAHESQLREPGDFLRTHMGRYEVLVTRGEEGSLHVLRNSCAHRGARLCTADRGKRTSWVCPYHAWTYRADGSLAAVSHPQSYAPDFDLNDPRNWLTRAPRVESYRGFVFANWAANGPSLPEYLGPMTAAFDNMVDRAPDGELEQTGGTFGVLYNGNWKMHMENANDSVHPSFVHVSSVASASANNSVVGIDGGQTSQMLSSNAFGQRQWDSLKLHGFEGGHSYIGGFYKAGMLAPDTDDPVALEYRQTMLEKYGKERSDEILGLDRWNNLIYPNLVVNAQYQQLRFVQPLSVDRSLIRGYCFRLKGAPAAMFQRTVRFLTTLTSPASMVLADDLEVFDRCQAGLAHQGIDWPNQERGYHSDIQIEPGALVSPGASELPLRAQAKAWLKYMQDQDAV